MAAAPMAHRRILSVSARAFVSPRSGNVSRRSTWDEIAKGLEQDGGNPVTIFYPLNDDKSTSSALTSIERTALAKSCDWESVIIEPHTADIEMHQFRFFMPSGDEVSFCGHAAIGASAFVANKESLIASNSLNSNIDTSQLMVPFVTGDSSRFDSRVCGDKVDLVMRVHHEESDCNQMPGAPSVGIIMNELGLDSNDLLTGCNNLPVYINSSVARPKTLIPIKSVEQMNAASAPKDPDKFRALCDSINSTGVYLYSQCKDSTHYEGRQFPRASGYAEDPATGIAAGALAVSLHARGHTCNIYSINQGSAMGRPSNIQVKIDSYNDREVRLSYTGLVVFDTMSCTEYSNL